MQRGKRSSIRRSSRPALRASCLPLAQHLIDVLQLSARKTCQQDWSPGCSSSRHSFLRNYPWTASTTRPNHCSSSSRPQSSTAHQWTAAMAVATAAAMVATAKAKVTLRMMGSSSRSRTFQCTPRNCSQTRGTNQCHHRHNRHNFLRTCNNLRLSAA